MFEKKTIRGYPKKDENLIPNSSGYHIFGQNIKYQYPQKVLLNEKYLCRLEKPILAYTSSVGEIGMIEESFYRSGDNGAFQALFPKFETYNKLHILFMLAILQKQFENFGYATSMKDILSLKLWIPVYVDSTPCHSKAKAEESLKQSQQVQHSKNTESKDSKKDISLQLASAKLLPTLANMTTSLVKLSLLEQVKNLKILKIL